MIAMIAIQLTVWCSVLMGIELMSKFFLVGRIVSVRIAVHQDVRSGFQAHEEH